MICKESVLLALVFPQCCGDVRDGVATLKSASWSCPHPQPRQKAVAALVRLERGSVQAAIGIAVLYSYAASLMP